MVTRPTTIHLSPLCNGTYTRLQISTSVITPMPAWALRRICSVLFLFSGERSRFVLSVDKETASWCEWWVDSIIKLPTSDSQVRFVRQREKEPRGR